MLARVCGEQLADQMTEAVTDAVITITEPGQPIDLHMVEIMSMTHKLGSDSKFVRGLVRIDPHANWLRGCGGVVCADVVGRVWMDLGDGPRQPAP